ncbi:hypothetical protein [Jeotgalibacillus campisalis]|uniref:DinB-like domain-containing protein n=1 Tax=Jeotgalibacillus campisalis TaxID=220754 RepID=A0A0C2VVJ8_9BACL|nr:hypothetical protein [Jeotgalibacillus campisalis]KIL48441.1 hypothetical protein KR50_14770 [Jeotgalibacillus campisalis]
MSHHPMVMSAKRMIQEAFEGPADPQEGSYYVNTEPNSGVLGLLESISAQKASQDINGTNLAAHTDHVRYYVWGTNEILTGNENPKMQWEESWKIENVSDEEWRDLQEELRTEYKKLLEGVDRMKSIDIHTNEVLGSLAHTAYHLGAMKQMMKMV